MVIKKLNISIIVFKDYFVQQKYFFTSNINEI
jgi:hypothetical protein